MAAVVESSAFPPIEKPENLLCNHHCEDLLKNLKNRQDLCDVVIKGSDATKRIRAHRLILIGSNDYFSSLLGNPKKREITIKEVDGDVLKKLIDYCYTGKLEFEGHTIEAVLIAASHLQLQEVVNYCCDFIQRHLSPSNCLAVASFAERKNIKALLPITNAFIKENFREVSNSPDFLRLNTKQLNEFISCDKLGVPCEFTFQVVMKWIEHEPEHRMKQLTKILAVLPLHLMSPTFLSKNVEPLCNTKESQNLISKALKTQLPHSSAPKSPVPVSNDLNSDLPGTSDRVRPISLTQSKYLLAITKKRIEEDDYFKIEGYDLRTRKWTSCDTKARYRGSCTVALMDDNLIVVGGENSAKVTTINLRTADISETTTLVQNRWCHGIVELNGSIYAIGGTDGNEDLSTVERWDHDKRTWNLVAPMKTARRSFGIGVHKGYLYVAGGWSKDEPLASVECYDSGANIWTIRASMKCRRSNHCLAGYKDCLYAIGGYQSNSVERYNTHTDTWTLISYSPLFRKHDRTISTSIDQELFIYDDERCYKITNDSTCENLNLKELVQLDSTDLVAFLGYNGILRED